MPTRAERRQEIIDATQGRLWPKAFGMSEGALAGRFADEVLSHQQGGGAGPALNVAQKGQILLSMNTIAKAWRRDESVLDRMSATVNSNASLKMRLGAIGSHDPVQFAAISAGYTSNPNGLAAAVNSAYAGLPQAVRQRAEAEASPRRSPSPPPPRAASPPQSGARTQSPPSPRREPSGQAAPEQRRETPQEVRPVRPAVTAAAEVPAVPTNGMTREAAAGIVAGAAEKIQAMYAGPDGKSQFDAQIETLSGRLQNPEFTQGIADAINRDPELLAQLTGSGSGGGGLDAMFSEYNSQTPEVQAGIRRGLATGIGRFLDDPRLIANESFRNELQGSAQSAGMTAGINGFMQKIFGEGFDISKIGQGIMSFIQPLIDMLGNLFKGFKASGGELSNVLSMGNGPGLSVPFLSQLGAAISSNENYINAEGRAVDRNRDGKFSDGMVFNPDGTPKMVAATNPDGSPRLNSNGSPVMQQEYNEALDDRITVKGQKVFEISGISDGQVNGSVLRAYATKVDMNSGQIVRSEIINIGPNGEAVITDPDTGQIRQPAGPAVQPPPAPANQDPANRNQPGLNQTPTPPTTEFGSTGIY